MIPPSGYKKWLYKTVMLLLQDSKCIEIQDILLCRHKIYLYILYIIILIIFIFCIF